jgi:prepilin-type processing-associated H-X9-DG protein
MSWQMYLQDYDEKMVPFWVTGVNDPALAAAGIGPEYWWPKLLDPYTKSWAIYRCPSAPDPHGYFTGGPNAWYGNQMQYSTIGYNYLGLGIWWQCNYTIGVSLATINRPAQTIAFTDSAFQSTSDAYPTNGESGFSTVQAPAQYAAIVPAPNTCTWYNGQNGGWDWTKPGTTPDFTGWSIARHTGGENCGWVDGHAKFQKLQQLWAGTNVGPGVSDQAVRLTDANSYLWNPDLNAIFGSVP